MKAQKEAITDRLLPDMQGILERGKQAMKKHGDKGAYLTYLREVHNPLLRRILAEREGEVRMLKAKLKAM